MVVVVVGGTVLVVVPTTVLVVPTTVLVVPAAVVVAGAAVVVVVVVVVGPAKTPAAQRATMLAKPIPRRLRVVKMREEGSRKLAMDELQLKGDQVDR